MSDAVLMRRALEYVKAFDGVIAQHAQEPRLTEGAQMNEGILSGVLGLQGWPAVAEEAIVARDVLLAEHVGSRLHVCHVSTAGTVEILRQAKARGVDVTAEVTPHHLLLTDDRVTTYDPVYKVNPPLRTKADVEALREALADGTIDAVATDHAPHAVEDKDCEWAAAAFGMLGLEQALAVVAETMVETGLLDWAGVADRMSFRPARIGRLGGHGRPIQVGEPANLVLVDPAARVTVEPSRLASKSRNTPYAGHDPSVACGRDVPARPTHRPRRVARVRAAPLPTEGRALIDNPGAAPAPGWPERIALTIAIVLFVGVALWVMWRFWRRPGRGQHDLPVLPTPPADLGHALAGPFEGRYLATTLSDDPAQRFVVHGLGRGRGRAAGRHRRRGLPRAHRPAWPVPPRGLPASRPRGAVGASAPHTATGRSSSSAGRTAAARSTWPSVPCSRVGTPRSSTRSRCWSRAPEPRSSPRPARHRPAHAPRRSHHDHARDPRARGRPHLPRHVVRRRG